MIKLLGLGAFTAHYAYRTQFQACATITLTVLPGARVFQKKHNGFRGSQLTQLPIMKISGREGLRFPRFPSVSESCPQIILCRVIEARFKVVLRQCCSLMKRLLNSGWNWISD